jgi:hypothetical protein
MSNLSAQIQQFDPLKINSAGDHARSPSPAGEPRAPPNAPLERIQRHNHGTDHPLTILIRLVPFRRNRPRLEHRPWPPFFAMTSELHNSLSSHYRRTPEGRKIGSPRKPFTHIFWAVIQSIQQLTICKVKRENTS